MKLRYLGLCGIDDSVKISHIELLADKFPFVEWGVLFRPDKEGEPRYASQFFIQEIVTLNMDRKDAGLPAIRFAAHLCGSRCQEVLNGNSKYVQFLSSIGFQRVQVNATVINGVDRSNKDEWVSNLVKCMGEVNNIEWIIQANDETKDVLVTPLEELLTLPKNMVILFDASCGLGVTVKEFYLPNNKDIRCGYAGGIGPDNMMDILRKISHVVQKRDIWIDMESSLRSIVNDADVFDLNKAIGCIHEAMSSGMLLWGSQTKKSFSWGTYLAVSGAACLTAFVVVKAIHANK